MTDLSRYPAFVFIAYDEDVSAQTHDVAVSLEAGSLVGAPLKYVRHDLRTPTAPALETVTHWHRGMNAVSEPLVTRTNAEAYAAGLVARREKECDGYRKYAEEKYNQVKTLEATIAEKDRLIAELEDENSDLKNAPWPEWASKVLAVIREYSGYDGYDDATEGVDLPAELEETFSALETDVKALKDRAETAEAELAKAREALEKIATYDESSIYEPISNNEHFMREIARAALKPGDV